MVRIEDATNITLEIDEFKPSAEELADVFSKCLSHLGYTPEQIDPEIFNVDDPFYVLSKNGDQYVVLYYDWADNYPRILTIENDSIVAWSEDKILEFVLNFANLHPGERLTPYDYREHFDLNSMESLIWGFRSLISQQLYTSLSRKEMDQQYRANMQALLQCLYNYDFSMNIKPRNILYKAEEMPCTLDEQQQFA